MDQFALPGGNACDMTFENLAFDIDGVVADTMAVFVDLAREVHGFADFSREHLRCFDLHRCLEMDSAIVDDLICRTLDDEHTLLIPPMEGAPEVLTALAEQGPLRFVTARIWPESITRWLHETLLGVPPGRIQVIATGNPEAKLEVLRELGVRYFVEDRAETCRILAREGIQPLLFDQPWNRGEDLFPRVENWRQLGIWIGAGKPEGGASSPE
jgi:hypothetical protein